MQVTWSAAAGQLQLNTKHTLAVPQSSTTSSSSSSSGHNKQQQQHVHFSHDQLKAGLCIRQETVSIMVGLRIFALLLYRIKEGLFFLNE